jgi:hypothetical protein
MKLVRDILREDFDFSPPYGLEFDSLPRYKRDLVFIIEKRAMEYKVAMINLASSADVEIEYAKAAKKIALGTKDSIPVSLKPRDVRTMVNLVVRLKADIQDLIRVYKA